jgi:hypothetical protein
MFNLPKIFQGMCDLHVGHLFLMSFISSHVAYSQLIKFNFVSKLPSPHFRNPDIFFLTLNPFTRKINKLLTKGCKLQCLSQWCSWAHNIFTTQFHLKEIWRATLWCFLTKPKETFFLRLIFAAFLQRIKTLTTKVQIPQLHVCGGDVCEFASS